MKTLIILTLTIGSLLAQTQLPFQVDTNQPAGPENHPIIRLNPVELLSNEVNFLFGPSLRPDPTTSQGQNSDARLMFFNQYRGSLLVGRVDNLNGWPGEELLQQWDPTRQAQYSAAFGWNNIADGGHTNSSNMTGSRNKGITTGGYENRVAGAYAQTFGQWNINMSVGGIMLGRENYGGHLGWPYSNCQSNGLTLDVSGDLRNYFPTNRMAVVRNEIPGTSFTPRHALVVDTRFDATNGVTTITFDRHLTNNVGRSGLIFNFESDTSSPEGTPVSDQITIGRQNGNVGEGNWSLGYRAKPPDGNRGIRAWANDMHHSVGDAQRVQAEMVSYQVGNGVTQYRWGPRFDGGPIMQTNSSWTIQGSLVMRRTDSPRAVDIVSGATFSALVSRTNNGPAVIIGSQFSAYGNYPASTFRLQGAGGGLITFICDTPMLTAPEKHGDTNNLVTAVTGITGLGYSTMTSGKIYVRFTNNGGGNYHANIYTASGGAGLIAHTGPFTVAQNGNLGLTTDNSSGLGGNVNILGTDIVAGINDEVEIQIFPLLEGVLIFDAASVTIQ